jgi:hypothetical protein
VGAAQGSAEVQSRGRRARGSRRSAHQRAELDGDDRILVGGGRTAAAGSATGRGGAPGSSGDDERAVAGMKSNARDLGRGGSGAWDHLHPKMNDGDRRGRRSWEESPALGKMT